MCTQVCACRADKCFSKHYRFPKRFLMHFTVTYMPRKHFTVPKVLLQSNYSRKCFWKQALLPNKYRPATHMFTPHIRIEPSRHPRGTDMLFSTRTPPVCTPKQVLYSTRTSTPPVCTPKQVLYSTRTSTPPVCTPKQVLYSTRTSTPPVCTPKQVLYSTRTPPVCTPKQVLYSTRTPPVCTPKQVLYSTRTPPVCTPKQVLYSTRTPPVCTPKQVLYSTRTPPVRYSHSHYCSTKFQNLYCSPHDTRIQLFSHMCVCVLVIPISGWSSMRRWPTFIKVM
jgi:hypothetical protein